MNGRRVARRMATRARTGALTLAASLALAGCGLGGGQPPGPLPETMTPIPETVTPPPETVTPPPAPVPPPPPPPAPGAPVATVEILTDPELIGKFAPAALQVPVGTTVNWEFKDTGPNGGTEVPHNVKSNLDASEAFASAPLVTTGTFSYTFTKVGTNMYTCTLHPGMDGVVEVVAA